MQSRPGGENADTRSSRRTMLNNYTTCEAGSPEDFSEIENLFWCLLEKDCFCQDIFKRDNKQFSQLS